MRCSAGLRDEQDESSYEAVADSAFTAVDRELGRDIEPARPIAMRVRASPTVGESHPGLARLVVGSVARNILQDATCLVLAVRESPPQAQ